jgi:hypothetical protein
LALDRQKLTYHDFWIRLIGYGFLLIGWGICASAILLAAIQLSGSTLIDRSTGLLASTGSTLIAVAVAICGSLPFILLGRWITHNYRKGRRSGF